MFYDNLFDCCSSDLKLYGYTGSTAEAYANSNSITFVPLNGSCGATDSDNVTWKLSADGTMTISGTGAMADYSVTRLAGGILEDDRPWKALVGMIKKSVIADGVTKVGNNAFARCANLTSATISNSVNTIGENAFFDCTGLNSVAILGSVSIIGKCAFYNCKGLNSVVILGSVNTIDQCAFWIDSGARKLNMYIMGSIQSIGLAAFSMYDDVANTIPLTNFKIYKCNDSVEQAFEAASYTTFTYSQSCFVITGGKWGTDYDYDLASGVLTVLTPTSLTIANVDPTTATDHHIVVKKDISANITIAGVNIENDSASPFEIEKDSEGNVTITLADGTTNKLSTICNAALQKEGDGEGIGKLTIQGGTLGTGELFVTSATGAGIGSSERFSSVAGNSDSVANITISGGKITAIISAGGAGIGSGSGYGSSGGLSDLTITGGTVTVESASGAGIGSGFALYTFCGTVSGITIQGGTVTASSTYGTDIGSGWGYASGNGIVSNIVITGGSVKASSLGCTPTDGEGNNVYLLTIPNPNGNLVIIDGKLWTPVNHTVLDPTDTNLYAYSTTENATTHTVTFNDGTNTTSYYVVGKLGNDAPATPTIPTGYTALDGWYTAAEGGTKFDLNTDITEDITLYARFTPNTYTVSYNAGANGTGTITDGTKTYGVDFTLSSDIFTRTGYTQTGWATTDGGEKVYDLGGSYTDNAAVTLYPVWKANQYTITVKPENGETDITITQDYGTTVTAPTLTRDGYAFDGWDKTFPTTMPAGSMTITAKWKDIAAPTGEITLGTNRWNKFLNSITFGLFFKDTQEITITATDNSGEDVTVEYLLSDKELSKTELATKTFTTYTDKFAVEPNNEYVIYAKLTDKSGNVSYINSNGIVLDNVKPVISSIEDGKTYCEAQTVTVSDKYEVAVTVNGNPVTPDTNGQFTLSAAEGEQKIVVTDKAGNQTEMTVTVNDGHTGGTADCTHKAKCEVCSEEYGEVNADDHTTLKHIEAKAATTEVEGNTEYWHCEECGKYFSDKDGKTEIKLADTVVAKLVKTDSDTNSPQTGDNSHMVLWIALLFVSGGALAGITVYGKKKKRFVK